jgi:hypothetical protein
VGIPETKTKNKIKYEPINPEMKKGVVFSPEDGN